VPAAVRRAGWGRQQGRHQRPQLVRDEVLSEVSSWRRIMPDQPRERNDVLYPKAYPKAAIAACREEASERPQ
jgi:hypothetical protein